MMIYHLIAYSLFIITLFSAILGGFLLVKNPRNSNINKSVAMISITSALYTFSAGMVYLRASMGLDYDFYYRACWVGGLSIPPGLQVASYLQDEKSRRAKIFGWINYPIWGLILAICLWTPYIEAGAYSLIPFRDHRGPFETFGRILMGVSLFYIAYDCFRLRKTLSGLKKAQLNYFLLGMVLYSSAAVVASSFFQFFGGLGWDPALTSYFSLPWTALTFYAVTRYRLFDIRVVISRTIAVSILVIFFGGINIGVLKILEPAIGSIGAAGVSLMIVTFLLLRTTLIEKVQNSTQNIFLKDKYNYQQILRESTKAIVTVLNRDDLIAYLVDVIKTCFKIAQVGLVLQDKEGVYRCSFYWDQEQKIDQHYQMEPTILKWLEQTKQVFIREEQERLMTPEEFDPLYGSLETIHAETLIPLFFKDRMIGALTLGHKGNREPYMQSDVDILETLASQAAIAIENSRLYDEAITDGLTELYHQKCFKMRLAEEVARFKRYHHAFSMMILDIDFFKKINDTHGHLAGDQTLKTVAKFLSHSSRKSDIVARYGGEEFALLLTNTDRNGAAIISERIRKGAEALAFDNGIKLTVSIGVGSVEDPTSNETSEAFIARVDKALYRAKERGRNRVEFAE